jgi:hypothetical protein
VSGQLHALAALPPGKEPPVPIGYEVGWTPEPVWTAWNRVISKKLIEKDVRGRSRGLFESHIGIFLD